MLTRWRRQKILRLHREQEGVFCSLFRAIELLLTGVPIERVSVLLGHQSVGITERHYSPWVRSRQEQLEADLVNAWSRDPVVEFKTRGYARYTENRVALTD